MAIDLALPKQLADAGWRVKISDKETVEPPHVTVIKRTNRWRWNLRDQAFMDRRPDPGEVPRELVAYLDENLATLVKAWDGMYPWNPVKGEEDGDE
ncbi:MAG TPA: hypothetical protein V6D47_02655 [Oscillatoriaceae cyanobacterium]